MPSLAILLITALGIALVLLCFKADIIGNKERISHPDAEAEAYKRNKTKTQ